MSSLNEMITARWQAKLLAAMPADEPTLVAMRVYLSAAATRSALQALRRRKLASRKGRSWARTPDGDAWLAGGALPREGK